MLWQYDLILKILEVKNTPTRPLVKWHPSGPECRRAPASDCLNL
jgi:hypothetical protein